MDNWTKLTELGDHIKILQKLQLKYVAETKIPWFGGVTVYINMSSYPRALYRLPYLLGQDNWALCSAGRSGTFKNCTPFWHR